mmetsp:Transcript_32312/g.77488  ORF Transcript_32312/g.77488 Transcript_32312/m.77488 type:complete len:326 (-) Transcript_32312:650-1627(-)
MSLTRRDMSRASDGSKPDFATGAGLGPAGAGADDFCSAASRRAPPASPTADVTVVKKSFTCPLTDPRRPGPVLALADGFLAAESGSSANKSRSSGGARAYPRPDVRDGVGLGADNGPSGPSSDRAPRRESGAPSSEILRSSTADATNALTRAGLYFINLCKHPLLSSFIRSDLMCRIMATATKFTRGMASAHALATSWAVLGLVEEYGEPLVYASANKWLHNTTVSWSWNSRAKSNRSQRNKKSCGATSLSTRCACNALSHFFNCFSKTSVHRTRTEVSGWGTDTGSRMGSSPIADFGAATGRRLTRHTANISDMPVSIRLANNV